MPKRDIRMSTKEIDDFLSHCEVVAVGAVDADGWPTATLSHCEFRNGALLLRLDPTDPVAVSASATQQLCCVADEHPTYYEIRGVILHGRPNFFDESVHVDIERRSGFDFGKLKR
jgi:nitroimidazol reductase NimA-like FMN-containing flavoprotein (pyridoxamine 5'-phosphate oxidase superfamily)